MHPYFFSINFQPSDDPEESKNSNETANVI